MRPKRRIPELVGLALLHAGRISQNELCRFMGWSNATISKWRQRKGLPTDDKVVQLAVTAQQNPVEWLLWLNIERTEEAQPHAHAIYLEMMEEFFAKKAQENRPYFAANQQRAN